MIGRCLRGAWTSSCVVSSPAQLLVQSSLRAFCSPTRPAQVDELLSDCQTIVDREVEWGDMDSFGHVNNARYIKWFEVVRIQHMIRMSGASKEHQFLSPKGVGPIIKDVYARFKGQVSFPDRLSFGIRTTSVEETSFQETYKIVSHKTKRVVCEGTGTIVTLDYSTGKRAPIPEAYAELLRKDCEGTPWNPKN